MGICIIDAGLKISNGLNNISDALYNVSGGLYGMSEPYENNYSDSLESYNLAQAATYLGISEENLMKIIEDKNSNIPYIKVGYIVTLHKHALDEWSKTATINID